MTAITRSGASLLLPARSATEDAVRRAARTVVEEASFARAARAQAAVFRAWNPAEPFETALGTLAPRRIVPILSDHDSSGAHSR
jgi:hypothetical protein